MLPGVGCSRGVGRNTDAGPLTPVHREDMEILRKTGQLLRHGGGPGVSSSVVTMDEDNKLGDLCDVNTTGLLNCLKVILGVSYDGIL